MYFIWHKYWRYDNEEDELKTIEKHLIDLNKKGYFFWGVFQENYSRAPIAKEKVEMINNQIRKNVETTIYFIETIQSLESQYDTPSAYSGILDQVILYDDPELHIDHPEYYSEENGCRLWFKVVKLDEINYNDVPCIKKIRPLRNATGIKDLESEC